MNTTFLLDLLTFALPGGFLSALITWLVSRRRRNNDMLAQMQASIDLLCEKYNDALQQNVALQQEKAEWLIMQQTLLGKIDKLTREVETLRRNITRKTPKNETSKNMETTPAVGDEPAAVRTVRRRSVRPDAPNADNDTAGAIDRATDQQRLADDPRTTPETAI